MLAAALRHLIPDCEVEHHDLSMLHDPGIQHAVAEAYGSCDHVISVRAAPEFGPLQDDVLARRVKALHFFPGWSLAASTPTPSMFLAVMACFRG